jgi:hypothetical protein
MMMCDIQFKCQFGNLLSHMQFFSILYTVFAQSLNMVLHEPKHVAVIVFSQKMLVV